MSRAFVKELDEQDDKGGPIRPQSPHVNYVTPRGMTLLQDKIRGLAAALDGLRGREDLASQQSIRELEREMACYSERVKRAVLIDPGQQALDRVHFGAAVEVEDNDGERLRCVIVGEDEADVTDGRISWVSPLASALMNARVGDVVTWRRPAGDKDLEVLAICRV